MLKVTKSEMIFRIVIIMLLSIITIFSIRTIKTLSNNSKIDELPLIQYANKEMTITFKLDTIDSGTFIQINKEDETRYVNDFNYTIKDGVLKATGNYDSKWNQTFTIMPDNILLWLEENIMLYQVNGYIYI